MAGNSACTTGSWRLYTSSSARPCSGNSRSMPFSMPCRQSTSVPKQSNVAQRIALIVFSFRDVPHGHPGTGAAGLPSALVTSPEPVHPLAWLEPHAARRRAAGLRRELRPRAAPSITGAEHLLDLAGNDYLGLATDPRVVDGAVRAVRTWGAGATGSRLVTGTTALHTELEAELA